MSNKKELQQWALEQLAKIDKEQPDLREMEMKSFQDSIMGLPQYWHIDEHGVKYLGTGMVPDNSCCDTRDRHYITGEELDTE